MGGDDEFVEVDPAILVLSIRDRDYKCSDHGTVLSITLSKAVKIKSATICPFSLKENILIFSKEMLVCGSDLGSM